MTWKTPTQLTKGSTAICVPHQAYLLKFSKAHTKTDRSNVNVCLIDDVGSATIASFNPIMDRDDAYSMLLSSPVPMTTIASILVSPESTRWDLECVKLTHGNETRTFTKDSNEFLENRILFTPEDTHVYDPKKHELGMTAYDKMKTDILGRVVLFGVAGTYCIALATSGSAHACGAYGLGGVIAYAYQADLHSRVDGVGSVSPASGTRFMGFLCLVALCIRGNLNVNPDDFLFVFGGFLNSKWANIV